ncbi:family 43 glycosylhydrolase [Pedobacter sp. SYP-B3415]|uniref:family 43 glycosylhydrolase n=1 Tax=Pedobacter sp. SYP-B3415 TaxID=2496641 RepID=UPI00101D1DC3|nr:family 43 glycosylhydrolase [Pedobacter sp. SYP-B3415]
MSPIFKRLAFVFLFVSFACPDKAQLPQNIANPVLPRVADAGIIRYNGEYYLGGVGTNGGFYRSSDLVNWHGPVHVFSMNNEWTSGASAGDSQIHASDIVYLNGIFHHYWSVNYWGRDRRAIHIGHATAKRISGPFREPDRDHWFENRIDPQLFVDDNGKLYFYMVKFTDGNTIWGRAMKDPWTFSGEPVYQFSSLRGTWETTDNRVAEGPWVIKYRDRYYMMYNANHTGPEWGNYALGVAEADSPLAFNHGNKYPYPVVQSNQIDMQERYANLLDLPDGRFRYTAQAESGWMFDRFDDSAWAAGNAGFGSNYIEGSTTRNVRTPWSLGKLYLRKVFTAPPDAGNLSLRIHHDGPARVWLNGVLVYENNERDYRQVLLDEKMLTGLKKNNNVLAIAAEPGPRSSFIDVALFAMGKDVPDDILFTPGQPNIIRGPNGLEWWLVYMANKNLEPRGQYINRVHFFGKQLIVDGPTASRTPGFHPEPAQPAFGDLFDSARNRRWQMRKGKLESRAGEGTHTGAGRLEAFPEAKKVSNYLFEANIKLSGRQEAGIFAWYLNENNHLQIGLDPVKKSWTWLYRSAGKITYGQHALRPGFDFSVYHKLGVTKNANIFSVEVDGLPGPGDPVIAVQSAAAGLPGVFSELPGTAFDGVIYTIGWDESGRRITGWKGVAGTAGWRQTVAGLLSPEQKAESSVFKGDPASSYEFSVQIGVNEMKSQAGIYAAYTDQRNYVKALIAFETGQLILEKVKDGKKSPQVLLPLRRRIPAYIDMKNTDMMEKHFSLRHRTRAGTISFKQDTGSRQADMEHWYRQGNTWKRLAGKAVADKDRAGYGQFRFPPADADGFKLVTLEEPGKPFAASKIFLEQLSKASYNLRTVRAGADLLIFVDNELVHRMEAGAALSKPGLVARGGAAVFDGITFFER